MFINRLDDIDPETRAEYYVGLVAELNSNSAEIQPQAFATRVLKKEHRKPFAEAVKKAGVPDGGIPKDTALIATKLKKMSIVFTHELTLTGTPDAFEERVEIVGNEGNTRVVITDEIEKFGK